MPERPHRTAPAHRPAARPAAPSTLDVSRETSPRPRRLRLAALALVALVSPAILAACGATEAPRGWAAAQPVTVRSETLVVVPYRGELFAIPRGQRNPVWQFPPRRDQELRISEEAERRLLDAIQALDVDADTRDELSGLVEDLRVGGDSGDALKDALDASAAPEDQRDDVKSLLDGIVDSERALTDDLRAFYGRIAVDDDTSTLYAASFKGVLFALDSATGRPRWMRDMGDRLVSGVALDDGTLYVGSDGNRLFALDAETAERRWEFRTDGEVWSTPVVSGGVVYVASLDGTVYAVDAESGEERWSFEAGAAIAADPAIAEGAVYIGAYDNKLYAIDAATGERRWTYDGGNWFWSTPLVSDGVVYAANLDGKVYAVDAATGDEIWAFDAGSPVRSSPVIAGGGLIVAARNGNVYKLDLASGEPDGGSPVIAGTRILADLTVDETEDGEVVYIVPRDRELYVLSAEGTLTPPDLVRLPD
jgi:outer membrane protein assembly factor BamB